MPTQVMVSKMFSVAGFMKTQGPRVQGFDIGASDTQAGATSTATASFTNAGLCDMSGNGSIADFNWKLSGEAASAFDIKVDITSGTFNSSPGASGTWFNLGTTRTWQLLRNTGAASVAATYSIRDASTLAVLVGPLAFNFDVDSGI